MWQAEEPTLMRPELRRVYGLPVEAGILFTNAQGVYSSHIEARKTQLLAQMTFLRKFLAEDEHILYAATAYSPMDWHTMGAMHGIFPLLTKQAVLVFTDRRFFHVPTTRLYEYRGSVAQAWYRDCRSMRVLRRATYLTLYLQYSSGLKESFRQIASADGAKITQLAAHLGDFASAGDTGGSSASRERHHLCPRCTQVLRPGVWACPACGLEFKNDREATTWTLAIPGAGFFYGRHPGLGTVVALSECMIIYVMLMGVHGLVWGVRDTADSATLLGLGGAFLAAMKLSALGAAQQFVAEFLPRRLKPLLDEAKAPDGPVLPRMRDPVMRGLVASLIILLAFVAFDRWRAMRPGAPPARAIPRGELPPCYEGAQDLMAPTPEMIAAQLQREEQDAIEGLRECASFTGRYPESLGPELQETVQQIRAGAPSAAQGTGSDVGSAGTREARAVRVISLKSFYTVLRRDWKEPVYYGDTVKPGEGERVLLRWQPARNEYRVVYGDLRAETVTAERLAQLEAGRTPAPCSQVRQPREQLPRARSMPVAMLLHQEVAALEGLRECGSSMGRYPESVGLPFDEMIRQIREGRTSPAQGAGGSADSVPARERRIERINRFLSFFAALRTDQREPVYHGDVVKPGQADRLLLRWQVEPNAYRVVYGDLRAEIVGAERLAQLEATLPE